MKIEAKDLRIGNWVYTDVAKENEKICDILCDGINTHISHMEAMPLDFIQGIPLTPEILEKAGFEYYRL